MLEPMCCFFQAEDGIRDVAVTGVQTCALPISCPTGAALRRGSPGQHRYAVHRPPYRPPGLPCATGRACTVDDCRSPECSERRSRSQAVFENTSGALGGGLGKGGVETEIGTVKKRRQFGKAEGKSFGGSRTHSDVTELAARAGNLSVQVQMRIGNAENFRRFGKVAD